MELYLVQHGASKTKVEDPQRALSDDGRRTVEQVADYLGSLGLALDRIEHSDKLRARQTAEILTARLHPREGTRQVAGIAPNDDVAPMRELLQREGESMLERVLKVLTAILILGLFAAAHTIPAGTRLIVRTDTQISSHTARAGDVVRANLARDLVVEGKTIARAGAPARGKVTYAKASGRLHAPGELALRLTSVEINGRMVPISTTAYRAKGKSHTKSNVTKIGGGAAAGAILGGVFGGGKGALIGTAAGGAAGTGLAAATGKQEAVIHAESVLIFSTTASAVVK